MKKILLLLLAALTLLFSAACGKGEPAEETPPEETPAANSGEPGAETETAAPESVPPAARNGMPNPLTGENTLGGDASGRPAAALVSNYRFAWPQRGVSLADIVVEMESEARETGFLCIYSDARAVPEIGPLNPMFGQFAQVANYLSPALLHQGYPFDDISVIPESALLMDGTALPGIVTLDAERRDDSVRGFLEEYCYFADGAAFFSAAGEFDGALPAVDAFDFADPAAPRIPSGGEATHLWALFTSFYDCDLRYDETSGRYLKWQFLQPQTDEGAGGEQLAFDNALVLFGGMRYSENSFNEDRMVDVNFAAGGAGYYLYGGRYEEIRWSQETGSPFSLTGADGLPLALNPGKTYVAVLDSASIHGLKIT